MEKQQEAQQDSISSVGVQMKDYPPSEVFTSEPPPAYRRPRAAAVQIARIAAFTLIAVSFILGSFMLASAYITASATCYTDYPPAPQQQENMMEDRPQYQQLIGEPLDSEESSNRQGESMPPPGDQVVAEQQSRQDQPIHFKLPLQLDFDELAGSLIEKNQRSRMNCVVEKRRAEEVTDHQPKTVKLPFGVNITSDPRYEHITGERMAIFCESGADQRHVPMDQQMTPIVVPIQVHQMPMHPNAIPQEMKIELRPNGFPHQIPPQFRPEQRGRMVNQQFQGQPPQFQSQPPQFQGGPPQFQGQPPQFQGQPPQFQGQPPQFQFQPQPQQVQIPHPGFPHHQQMTPQQLPPQFHPHQIAVEQAIQAIEQEALQQSPEEHQVIIQGDEMVPLMQFQQEVAEVPSDTVRPPPLPFHRLPIQQEGSPLHLQHHQGPPPTQLHLQHQQGPPPTPLHLQHQQGPPPPTPLQLQQVEDLPSQPSVPQQDPRPHFVQPRSVRSVESVLHPRDKRVRRCACDCAC